MQQQETNHIEKPVFMLPFVLFCASCSSLSLGGQSEKPVFFSQLAFRFIHCRPLGYLIDVRRGVIKPEKILQGMHFLFPFFT